MHEREFKKPDIVEHKSGDDGEQYSPYESYPCFLGRHCREQLLGEALAQRDSERESSDIRAPDDDEEAKKEITAEIAGLVERDEIPKRDRDSYVQQAGVDV